MNGPIFALVGRQNVGKSTLFNRLTKTQDALVADIPGLTRDRQYGRAVYEGIAYCIIDTGGLTDEIALPMNQLSQEQSMKAVAEADCVLFLVDGRSGLMEKDRQIAQQLRKANKQVVLIVNKAEGLDSDFICADFQSLGFAAMHTISAAHGQGIASLLTQLLAPYTALKEEPIDTQGIRLAFLGRPNVGKSTLINRMLGEARVVVCDKPGTTRDSIAIPFTRAGQAYTLIDTAGIRRRGRVHEKIEKFSVIKSMQAIEGAQVCLLLIDGQEGITEQDLHLLSFVIEAGKALVFLVNKWDGLSDDQRAQLKSELDRRLQFMRFARIHFISALYGTGVGSIFPDIQEAYASATQSFSTTRLTELLQAICLKHPPPCVSTRRIKLRYAHLGGHNPPIIVIHGNQLGSLPNSYKRYLSNAFAKQLQLVGTPLKIEFKAGVNPFAHKVKTQSRHRSS